MDTALTEGLEIVGVVAVATSILVPVFCWLLMHRSEAAQPENV